MSGFLDFGNSELSANNLGGQGPELTDPEYIEYTNLLELLPEEIVLRITNTTEYTPAMIESTNGPKGVDFNGLSGQFGIINVLSDTSVKLKFEFINTTDESPYTLEGLYFSWFDLDQGPTGNRQEKVILDNTFDFYFVSNTTTVIITDEGDDRTGFCSSVPGTAQDNPMDPLDLTPEQEDKAVTAFYTNVHTFCAEIMIGGPPNIHGRNLIYGGMSSIVSSPPPPSPPPSPPPAPFAPSSGLSPPPPGAVIKSDPHFQGLDGKPFDFNGVAGNVYVLLFHAHDGLELIARFATAYTSGMGYVNGAVLPYKAKGTWLASIGLRVTGAYSEEYLIVAPSSLGAAGEIHTRHGYVLHHGGHNEEPGLITYTIAEHGSIDVVEFASESLEGQAHIVPPPEAWEASDDSGRLTHINVEILRLSIADADHLEGVLGITASGRQPKGRGEEFLADGSVDELFINLLP